MKPSNCIGYLGVGAYLPSTVLTNHDLEKIVDTSDEWIRRRTGIERRRVMAPDETILDMATAAARAALADAGVEADRLVDIRVGVNTWGRFPSLATQLQAELGAWKASAADLSAGCAGFVYAVEDAYHKLLAERSLYGSDAVALVVGVDALSLITNWRDRGTCVLLGDGAGAVVLGPVERGGILAVHTHADGRYGNALYSDAVLETQWDPDGSVPFSHRQSGVRPYLRMDGRKVYGIAVRTMVEEIHAVLARANARREQPLTVADIDFIWPHQANLRIIEKVAERLDVPLERVYTHGIVEYGNTSTASIPLGYCDPEARGRPPRSGGYEIDVAFGAGFASGAILRQIP